MQELEKNNFKELEKEHIKDFEAKSDGVKQKIEGETSAFRYIGDIIDLYFSKVMNVFLAMAGGKDDEKEDEKD